MIRKMMSGGGDKEKLPEARVVNASDAAS
jgi:hypothetical protein